MILIEGADGGGKSTLVKWLRDNTYNGVVKPYYPKVNQLSYYLHSASHYSGYFLERYYLSEIVYPRIKKDRVAMEDWKQFLIEAALMPYAPVILYLRPDKETIIENYRIRGDHYINEDEIDRLIKEYDWAIERSHIPHIKYNYKENKVEDILIKITNLYSDRCDKTEDMRYFLSSGNSIDKEGLMFIGEDPSDKSIGEGYIRAFISDKGSSAFLHQILYEAGIYDKEMPYFTNWGKGLDNDEDKKRILEYEIEQLNPRKIICFGKDIQEKVGQGEYVEHPAYVKRFYSKDYQWYINKIKELV